MSHVALVIPTLDRIGGAERQTMLLAAALRGRGWRVTVVTLSGSGGDAKDELAASNVGFFTLESRRGLVDPRGWLRMNRWLRREQPEIVHAHLPHAAWMARWSRLFAPGRVVVDTIHTSATGTWGRERGYRWSDWLPDEVTAVSEGARGAWIAARMVVPERCVVVPNGIDTQLWQPDAQARASRRAESGLGDEFLWFAAGRLDPVKDYETMLRSFAQVAAHAHLVVAGTGPLESDLRELCMQLGVADRVQFLGFVADVRGWIQAADGFLLTSKWEGLPMGLLEAGACALPAIATDVAGSREIIADGETGWLTPIGSPEMVAEKMRLLMGLSAEDHREMGSRARKRIIAKFSLASVLDRWEALYRGLLDKNPTPRRRANLRELRN